MSVNFNLNSISSAWANVDVQNVGNVTEQILKRAQQKTVDLNKVDLSKFNRQTLGVDLYNGNTSVEAQKQISMMNAGLLNTANVNVAYINSQAATALYGTNVAKQVEGKMTINLPEGEKETTREIMPLPKSTEVFSTANLAKDKRGSNPFATQESIESEDNHGGLDILG
ncbi:MAG: hypothetical protein E7Z91_02285 [Cyanobacteria bacterium SIG30]|nr:hypothetical protein [Cyanobacteria bacterium SIG30]